MGLANNIFGGWGNKGGFGDNCAILFFIILFLLLFTNRCGGFGGINNSNLGC
jgi:nitrate/nitrite transporter NarK